MKWPERESPGQEARNHDPIWFVLNKIWQVLRWVNSQNICFHVIIYLLWSQAEWHTLTPPHTQAVLPLSISISLFFLNLFMALRSDACEVAGGNGGNCFMVIFLLRSGIWNLIFTSVFLALLISSTFLTYQFLHFYNVSNLREKKITLFLSGSKKKNLINT